MASTTVLSGLEMLILVLHINTILPHVFCFFFFPFPLLVMVNGIKSLKSVNGLAPLEKSFTNFR